MVAKKKETVSKADLTSQMRTRFAEITAQRDQLQAALDPLQAEHDFLSQEFEAKMRPVAEKIKAARAPIEEIERERASLCHALGGKTGEQPQAA